MPIPDNTWHLRGPYPLITVTVELQQFVPKIRKSLRRSDLSKTRANWSWKSQSLLQKDGFLNCWLFSRWVDPKMNIGTCPQLNLIYTVYKHDKPRFDYCTLTIISSPLVHFLVGHVWQNEATKFTKTQPVPARQKPDNANTESMFSRDIHVTPDSSTNLLGNLSLQIGRANWFPFQGVFRQLPLIHRGLGESPHMKLIWEDILGCLLCANTHQHVLVA